MTLGALIASLALCAALTAMLFWQAKRAAGAMDGLLNKASAQAELRALLSAAEVAAADKERAINILTAERDRLQSMVSTVEDQRDALLKESLEHATPSTIAAALRDALQRLRPPEPEVPEASPLPDVPSPSDSDGD